MEPLTLNKIHIEPTTMGTKITYDYDAPECLRRYIKGDALFVEFPGDVQNVPKSILTIPFVGVMLTVGMLLKVNIHVPELDASFHGSVEKTQAVFRKMYSCADLRCKISADHLIKLPGVLRGGIIPARCSLLVELMQPVLWQNCRRRTPFSSIYGAEIFA